MSLFEEGYFYFKFIHFPNKKSMYNLLVLVTYRKSKVVTYIQGSLWFKTIGWNHAAYIYDRVSHHKISDKSSDLCLRITYMTVIVRVFTP